MKKIPTNKQELSLFTVPKLFCTTLYNTSNAPKLFSLQSTTKLCNILQAVMQYMHSPD